MGTEERAHVVDSLPGEVTWDEMAMPEGDQHFQGKVQAMDALRGYFKRQQRKVYLGAELPIYYPDERRFAPDLISSTTGPGGGWRRTGWLHPRLAPTCP